MNMSGHFPGPPFMPPGPYFGPPPDFFRPPNRQQYFEPPVPPPSYDQSNQQQFAEYSLWGDCSYRLDPAELIHPRFSQEYGPVPSQPSPVPPYQAPELPDELPMPPQTVPDKKILMPEVTDEETSTEEPEETGLEEPEKHVIYRDDLFKHPDNFYFDLDSSSSNLDTLEQVSNSSGSSAGDWTNNHFQRAGAAPSLSAYPWNSRPSRVVNSRGRQDNLMQRRLVKALSQPVKLDKGASMMQRMGWMGGGLGREENGSIDPIAPNAIYATTTVGFGQEVEQIAHLPPRKANRVPCVRQQRSKKLNKEHFKTNVLLHLLDFVKSDLKIELYFDVKLKSNERKRIHKLVASLSGKEDGEELDTNQQHEIVNDIHRRNNYVLSTQSEGEGLARQLCVFKEAPSHMFLVTPDDCRPCITDITEIQVEEESNPFLKSITKHIKPEGGAALSPKPPHLFDKLAQYFIDFSTDVYTEFRFLGPFTKKEIFVINNFFVLISDLSNKRKPYYKCSVDLLNVFATERVFNVALDVNGFTSIKKECSSVVDEDQKKT